MDKIIIKIKNVASYKKETKLETDKKINLVYGLNGTGKTILSNYLYLLKDKNDEPESRVKFQDCDNNFDTNDKILVYNEKFTEDNFYKNEKIPGIFTLSSENKEAENKIKNAQTTLNKIREKEGEVESKIDENQKNFETHKNKIQEKTWKIKEDYTGGDRPLDYCLEGLKGDKKKLLDKLCDLSKPENRPQETIDELEKGFKSIQEGIEIKEITELETNLSKIESNPIFKEIIIGNQNSAVAQLIREFENPDWVKSGLKYLPKDVQETIKCPFCQQNTITKDLAENIKKYFDTSYKEKLEKITSLQKQYEGIIDSINDFENQDNTFIKEEKDRFQSLISSLKPILDENLKKIKEKEEKPSKEIDIKHSDDQIFKINQFVEDINTKISEYNEKIKNSEQEKKTIKNKFWKIMRWEYDQIVENYKEFEKSFKDKEKKLKEEKNKYKKEIESQKKIIKENQSRTINLAESIENINKNLKDIGIIDFTIDKVDENDGNFYFLKRNSDRKSDFKSFSEGEKTLISFLYFLELCRGKKTREEVDDKKVIVIDDPISSLSHIYVFNIAHFIRNNFFNEDKNKNYQKIFILTHNLYFFHELAHHLRKKGNEQVKFFRITKNPSSLIVKMKENEIKNTYESYWEILKEYQNTDNPHPILPNVMRNILEHFFGFIDKSNFSDVLDHKIDEQKYGPFIRYMNRESHSDRVNDSAELDHSLFFRAFKEVFEKSGHGKHYKKMMET